jgi:hypothetical protein
MQRLPDSGKLTQPPLRPLTESNCQVLILLAAATESQVHPDEISTILPTQVGVGLATLLLAITTDGGEVTGRLVTPQLDVREA